MDISNLDCPQYVKFPIDELELSYSIEDSLNVEKHEDSHTDLSIPNDDESYIVIEDSSHTENSFSENEECSVKKHEVSSEKGKDDQKQSDISDPFVSAIGSSFEENSCTEEDIKVPVKSEDQSEHISNNIQSDVFDHLDCMVDSAFTAISCVGSEVLSEHVEAENIQSDVLSNINSMVDSISEAFSHAGPGVDSKPINNQNTLSFVLGQSDCSFYLDAEASSERESALSVHAKSEDQSEDVDDSNIQSDVFDHLDCIVDTVSEAFSCAGFETPLEHLREEKVQSEVPEQCESMVEIVPEAISCEGSEADSEPNNNESTLNSVSGQSDCSVNLNSEASSKAENALLVHVKSEDHSEHEDNLQNDVFDHLNYVVDSVSMASSDAGFEAHSEHVGDQKVESDIPELLNNVVDIVSEAKSCEGSEADSEPINNESTLNSVCGQSDCSVDLDAEASSKAENALSVHIQSVDHSEHVKDKLQSEVFDHLNYVVESVSMAFSDASFEAHSEHVTDKKEQSEVPELHDNMVDVVSEAVSCEGSGPDSEHINNGKTHHLFGQSDCMVDLDAAASSSQENALSAHIESEIHSEEVKDNNLQNDVFDIDVMVDCICAAHIYAGARLGVDIFDQGDGGVDLDSETGAENALAMDVEEEIHAEDDEDNNLQRYIVIGPDCVVDSVSAAFSCAGAELHSEDVKDEKMLNVPDQCNSMVDSLPEVNSGAEDDILVCDKAELHSEDVKDEKMLDVPDQCNSMVDSLPEVNSGAEDDTLVCDKTNRSSGQIENEVIQCDVLLPNSIVDSSSKDSCESVADPIHFSSESNSDLKDANDEIVQREDTDEFCMAISSENEALVEDDLNSKDSESKKKNKSNAQKNQVCDISKVSSGSKGAIPKNKQDAYVPLAQQVAAFQQRCPDRYLSSHAKNFQSTKNWAPPKYVPKAPNLQAAKRHREIKTNTEDVKRYEFHARPFNPKIFEKPKTLETEKQSTQPKTFSLKTAQRAEAHVKNDNLDAKKNEFHARPAPKSCHVKQNEPEKVKIHATKPKSPNFALKNREEKWSQRSTKTNDDTKPSNHKICPKQPKQTDLSQSVMKHEKKPIEILPFSFEEREKARLALKQQKSQDLGKENQKPGFKAREMPSFGPPALPSIQRKKATQPEPFFFCSESRISSQKGDTTIADKTALKTHSDNVLKTVNPKKVLSLAEAKEFQLHTEKRAKEWKQIEELRKAEEMEKQQALEAYKAAKETQEQREIMKMRQDAVHKANPIRAYKSVEIKPSNLVTQPFTPKFETDKRLQSRLDKTEVHF